MASIYILGAGAMGCLWASHLHRALRQDARHSVAFLSTKPDTNERVTFSLTSPFLSPSESLFQTDLPVSKPADLNIATSDQPNIILLCTKSYHALDAALQLKPFLNEHSYLVLFQNGLGSQYAILDALGDIAIYAAVSTEGVNRQASGKLVHAGKGLTRIGPLNDTAREISKFRHCLEMLSHDGIETLAQETIWPALWEKLAINCAINPFTAILDCPNGEIKNSPLFQQNWPALKQELCALLNQAGMSTLEDELEQSVFQVIEHTRSNISSMLQDIRAHRKTEIDDINGFAADYLSAHNLPSIINSQLSAKVREIQ
jgi:2-dehydropantoate 2-reductase